MYVIDGNILCFWWFILLDELINFGRLFIVFVNFCEGVFYVDISNLSYECVRIYIGGRWNR